MVTIEINNGVYYPVLNGERSTIADCRKAMQLLGYEEEQRLMAVANGLPDVERKGMIVTIRALRKQIPYTEVLDNGYDMPESVREELIAFLGKGCQANTRAHIRSTVTYNALNVDRMSILEGLRYGTNGWQYSANSSYNEEMRTVRSYFI